MGTEGSADVCVAAVAGLSRGDGENADTARGLEPMACALGALCGIGRGDDGGRLDGGGATATGGDGAGDCERGTSVGITPLASLPLLASVRPSANWSQIIL